MERGMNTESKTVELIAGRIAAIEDRIINETDILATTKERLVFDPRAYRRRVSRLPFIAAAAVAAAAAALLIVVWQPKSITVQADGKPLDVGAWISSPPSVSTALSFSDGSSVSLSPASGLRIRDLSSTGAHLLLERGSLEASVSHRDDTHWKLDVGPYIITVVGTRFQVSWNPDRETFDLEMTEGSVKVEGPMVSERTVSKGETLFASLPDGTVHISVGNKDNAHDEHTLSPVESERPSLDDEAVVSSEPASLDFSGAAPRLNKSHESRREKKAAVKAEDREDWRRLADLGHFSEAVQAAEKIGIHKILTDAAASDLLALGDAARHAGDFSLAKDAYIAARRRFPQSTHASSAAFSLGIMAFDGRRDFTDAARWFNECLKNKRSDALAKEAAGRLMEAYRAVGDDEAAREAAASYLEKYPNGPHAALAKRLTQ